MIAPVIPENEEQRLSELYKYELLDTVYEREFEEVVQLASKLCNVPISLITLVDLNRQWFKARVGLDVSETERSVSFCGHAIHSEHLFEVEDAVLDIRFFDNPLVTGDPQIRYYGGMPLVTESGHKIGTLCVIDRIPRQLDKEQSFALNVLSKQVIKMFELRVRNKELKKVMDVQQRIMTIMAHDVRDPLASIKLSYELKNSGDLPESQVKEIDHLIPLQMESTIHLLNNIVDWGKLQLGDPADDFSTFSLHDLCHDCFDYLLMKAAAKKNTLRNLVSRDLLITGSRQGTEFILRNLLGNANKFTSSGEISVTAVCCGDYVEITVKDTGVGMSMKAQESIMQRTWTTVTSGTQKEKGSGMGLKMVYEYLANVGGGIQYVSEPGQGTQAVVRLAQ